MRYRAAKWYTFSKNHAPSPLHTQTSIDCMRTLGPTHKLTHIRTNIHTTSTPTHTGYVHGHSGTWTPSLAYTHHHSNGQKVSHQVTRASMHACASFSGCHGPHACHCVFHAGCSYHRLHSSHDTPPAMTPHLPATVCFFCFFLVTLSPFAQQPCHPTWLPLRVSCWLPYLRLHSSLA